MGAYSHTNPMLLTEAVHDRESDETHDQVAGIQGQHEGPIMLQNCPSV